MRGVITLPAGTTHVNAADLPRMIVEALFPGDPLKQAQALPSIEEKVRADIASGVLKVANSASAPISDR